MTLMTKQPQQDDFKGGELVQFKNDHDEQVIGQISEDRSHLQEMVTDLTGDYEPVGTPYDLAEWDLREIESRLAHRRPRLRARAEGWALAAV